MADDKRNVPEEEQRVKFGSKEFFLLCGAGGMLSCGLTHLLITPLDLMKCRIQANPLKYRNLGESFKATLAEEGIFGFSRGWLPTILGYSAQGIFKFGLYEWFKIYFGEIMTAHNPNERQEFVYAISSSSAEFFADFALAPFEVCKVRMQTSAESSRSFVQTVRTIINEEGLKSLYKNLIPLWLRQVPYTMTKFTTFETTLESIYKFVLLKPREDCSEGQQLAATFAAGYIAGIICAAVSHPADSVISKLGQAKSLSIVETTRKLGWYGIWRGLGSRTLMIGTLTGLQWLAYDSFKTLFNVPRSKAPGK